VFSSARWCAPRIPTESLPCKKARAEKGGGLQELSGSQQACDLQPAPGWSQNGLQIQTQDSNWLRDFEPYGSTNVLIRFGSSWVGMRATSFIVFASMADTVFSAELVT
jgi:hypothetical protein